MKPTLVIAWILQPSDVAWLMSTTAAHSEKLSY